MHAIRTAPRAALVARSAAVALLALAGACRDATSTSPGVDPRAAVGPDIDRAALACRGCNGNGGGLAAQTGVVFYTQQRRDRDNVVRKYVFRVNADGSGKQQLALGSYPAVSPDGARVAFQRELCANVVCHEEIFVMNADGSAQMQLTNSMGVARNVLPAWSPDGEKIAFASDRADPQFDVFVMRADGSSQVDITPTPPTGVAVNEGYPTWSPDGASIAYSRTVSGQPTQLWKMSATGAGQTLVYGPSNEWVQYPQWSPDGTRIAFSVSGAGCDLRTVRPDGSGLVWVNIAQLFGSPAIVGCSDPTWSPDGAALAFTSGRAGIPGSYVATVKLTGQAYTEIVYGGPGASDMAYAAAWYR